MDSIIKRVPDNTDYNMFEETKKMISNDKNDIIKRKAMEESVDRPNKKQCTFLETFFYLFSFILQLTK